MADVLNVELAFDPDAQVWFVKRSDVHGLRLEAPTVDALVERIPAAMLDLLEDRAGDGRLEIPIEVTAHRRTSVRLEAA